MPTRYRRYTDTVSGARRQVEAQVAVKPWWFTTASGELAVSVRYGSRVLELARGKYAVVLAHPQDLTVTLDTIRAAVLAGKLDAAINTAATKPRAGFERSVS